MDSCLGVLIRMRFLAFVFLAIFGLLMGCSQSADDREPAEMFVTVEKKPQPNELSREQASEGWIQLFDGETLFGWTGDEGHGWHAEEDGTLVFEGATAATLKTTTQFSDYELRWESWVDNKSDGGIVLRAATDSTDGNAGYEIPLSDSDNSYSTGSLAGRAKANHPVASSGEWTAYSAVVQGNQLSITAGDKELVNLTEDNGNQPKIGCVALQGDAGPLKFRNIYLKPLNTQALFNGKDLTGWRPVPGGASEFHAVIRGKEAFIYVHKGGGYLETEEIYDDFLFQAEISFNGQGYDGGILFRAQDGTAEAPANGYEVQLNNEVRSDDRTQPLDFGTGGLYGLVPARRQVAQNFFWFTPTLSVQGNHVAVWVNGIQVTDWTDTRPPSDNPREGSRTKAGRLSLEAQGEKTDIFFRNLRMARLPERT
ncbi:MAG: DUF1080 domain-containing protein [Planctomycetaceae bacterium]